MSLSKLCLGLAKMLFGATLIFTFNRNMGIWLALGSIVCLYAAIMTPVFTMWWRNRALRQVTSESELQFWLEQAEKENSKLQVTFSPAWLAPLERFAVTTVEKIGFFPIVFIWYFALTLPYGYAVLCLVLAFHLVAVSALCSGDFADKLASNQ